MAPDPPRSSIRWHVHWQLCPSPPRTYKPRRSSGRYSMPDLVADPLPLLAAVADPPPILALVVFPGATPAVGELPPPPRRFPLRRERVNEQRAGKEKTGLG
jgi:hypothetical protein